MIGTKAWHFFVIAGITALVTLAGIVNVEYWRRKTNDAMDVTARTLKIIQRDLIEQAKSVDGVYYIHKIKDVACPDGWTIQDDAFLDAERHRIAGCVFTHGYVDSNNFVVRADVVFPGESLNPHITIDPKSLKSAKTPPEL